MSNLANVVGAVIGLAAISRLLDRADKVTPAAAPKPLIKTGFVTGPAGPSADIKPLIPEGAFTITQQQLAAYVPQTPEQAALTRERVTAPSGTPEQAAIISEAYRPGKITPLGFREGETGDDLVRRLYSK